MGCLGRRAQHTTLCKLAVDALFFSSVVVEGRGGCGGAGTASLGTRLQTLVSMRLNRTVPRMFSGISCNTYVTTTLKRSARVADGLQTAKAGIRVSGCLIRFDTVTER
jgi:hypothetical protein